MLAQYMEHAGAQHRTVLPDPEPGGPTAGAAEDLAVDGRLRLGNPPNAENIRRTGRRRLAIPVLFDGGDRVGEYVPGVERPAYGVLADMTTGIRSFHYGPSQGTHAFQTPGAEVPAAVARPTHQSRRNTWRQPPNPYSTAYYVGALPSPR